MARFAARRAVPDRRPPLFPLEGRSLTFAERGQALLTCMDRRIEALQRGERLPFKTGAEIRAELEQEIANVEGRRMLERLVAGESWEDIRASVVQGRAAD